MSALYEHFDLVFFPFIPIALLPSAGIQGPPLRKQKVLVDEAHEQTRNLRRKHLTMDREKELLGQAQPHRTQEEVQIRRLDI